MQTPSGSAFSSANRPGPPPSSVSPSGDQRLQTLDGSHRETTNRPLQNPSDIVILGNRLRSVLEARDVSRRSDRKTKQNVFLAFLFNGVGIPLAATGLIYPVWAMIAKALSVTTIFINSVGDRPRLRFEALMSVGRERSTSAREPVAPAAVAQ